MLKFSLCFVMFFSLLNVTYSQLSNTENSKIYVESTLSFSQEFISQLDNQLDDNQLAIISHGSDGELLVDGKMLSDDALLDWLNNRLTKEKKEVLIFGCDFASGNKGKESVHKISESLNVVVYASTNKTGFKGDWILEYSTKNAAQKVGFKLPLTKYSLQVSILNQTSVTAGNFVVGQTGTYSFVLRGGEGGDGNNTMGGNGATVSVEFFLQTGDVVNYLVGEGGRGGNGSEQAGGGGSTGVYINGVLAAVAGGGGGGDNSTNAVGLGGASSENGLNGTSLNASAPGSGGVGGNGGTSGASFAGGGGGFLSDGSNGASNGGKRATVNFTLASGGDGSGSGTFGNGGRGFSGGGGGGNNYSGGGGGYSGGGAAGFQGSAGGGGSFYNDTMSSYLSGSVTAGANGASSGGAHANGADGVITVSAVYFYDNDLDGVQDRDDLDDDNDGVPDVFECGGPVTNSFSGGNGGSTHNYSVSNVSSFYIDFGRVDNSVSITINGNGLHANNIFELEGTAGAGEVLLRIAATNANLSQPWVANTNGLPRLRVIVDQGGFVTVYGTPNVNSTSLELMETANGSSFNQITFNNGSNAFSIVNPNDSGADGITGTAYTYVECDTDLDGIPNRYDLDADDDGCSDAFESGATSNQATEFSFSDVNGDADGLSPSVDSNNDGVVDHTILYDFLDYGASSCDCPYYSGSDSDGDTYDDICDLDDDNDGILDVSEFGSCGDGVSLTWEDHYNEGTGSFDVGDDPQTAVPSPALTFGPTTISYSRSENITIRGETAEFRINDLLGVNGLTLYQEALIDARSVHTFNFSEPVYGLSFTLYDLDWGGSVSHFQDYVKIKLIAFDGSSYEMTSGDYTTSFANEYLGFNTFRGIDENGNLDINPINEWIVSMEIVYYNGIYNENYSFTNDNAQAMTLGEISFCTPSDADGDGIADAHELDSDGDMCPDAIEAGFTYNDIHLSGSKEWEIDTTIATNGVPTATGVASNNFVIDVNSQGPNCESFFVLAIELTEFNVKRVKKNALLSWSTLSEKENDFFEVKWSTDGINWELLGIVNGAGYSDTKLEYQFVHENPRSGINYYKIIDVDLTGKKGESEVKILDFKLESNTVNLFPNPNNNTFYLTNVDNTDISSIKVYDTQGKSYSVGLIQDVGEAVIKVEHDLAPGTYLIQMSNLQHEIIVLRFVVE